MIKPNKSHSLKLTVHTKIRPYYRNIPRRKLYIKVSARSIAGGGMFTQQQKIEARNSNRANKKCARQYSKKLIKEEIYSYENT